MTRKRQKPVPSEKPASPTDVNAPPTPPDLSHIAEALRPLAVPCDSIALDPKNAKTHGEENLSAIRGSLKTFGQRKPIVVNRRTGTVEAGNGALQSARDLGWTHIAVVYVDDDPVAAAGFAIADNRTAELAEWDEAALALLLPELDRECAELEAMIKGMEAERAAPDVVQGGGYSFLVKCELEDRFILAKFLGLEALPATPIGKLILERIKAVASEE